MVQKSQKAGRKKPRKSTRNRPKSHLAKSSRQGKSPPKKAPPRIVDLTNPLDRALALMKGGTPQKAAAKAEGVSVKALRNFARANTSSKFVHGEWIIKDRRAVMMLIFADGGIRSIAVRKTAARSIGLYWNAVNRFLDTNDISHLQPYRDVSVRDVYGKQHVFETNPNVLRRGDSIGDLSFHTLYANTAN